MRMRRRAGVEDADAVGWRGGGGRKGAPPSGGRRPVELPAARRSASRACGRQSSSSSRRYSPALPSAPCGGPPPSSRRRPFRAKAQGFLGRRHRCVVGPHGALSIPLYLEEAGGRRLFPVLLQEAAAGVKTPKFSCRSRWRSFAGTSADGLTMRLPS
jgi:hypothetical protein